MNSLVSADYGSSSSDDNPSDDEVAIQSENHVKNLLRSASDSEANDSFDDDNSLDEPNESNETKKAVLPSASSILLNGSNNTGQVFNNPYKKAEIDQIASLEKHVKMVDTDAHIQIKNGKKICWNYRKGRCRFGSNCAYAHDSDLHVTNDANTSNEPQQTTANVNDTHIRSDGTTKLKLSNKKRSGLGDSIVPSKKVMKSYNALKK